MILLATVEATLDLKERMITTENVLLTIQNVLVQAVTTATATAVVRITQTDHRVHRITQTDRLVRLSMVKDRIARLITQTDLHVHRTIPTDLHDHLITRTEVADSTATSIAMRMTDRHGILTNLLKILILQEDRITVRIKKEITLAALTTKTLQSHADHVSA